MKAAVVTAAGKTPQYLEFKEPVRTESSELIAVHASALSHFTKGRASGSHYSSDGVFPLVAGADGIGTTQDGRRVYFAIPEAPFGAMAQRTVVRSRLCIDVPSEVDNITAAAIANPGMSAWAALAERAHLKPGETVLINGATGTAGRLAVQIAKYMGAAKVIATGRNHAALEELKSIGADEVIPFDLGLLHPHGAKAYKDALKPHFAHGVNVVLDYLWGKPAEAVIAAIARAADDATPVRFVHIGGVTGDDIQLPGAALRSSPIVLLGSGNKSVPMPKLLSAVENVFKAVVPASLQIATKAVPLSQVAHSWSDEGQPRVVFVID